MDENLHNIDDLFRKAINEYENAPPESVWENIDKSLDKQKVLSISKKYQNLKWVAAALLIFSAGMAMYTWNTRLRNKELVRETGNKLKKDNTHNPNNSTKLESADVATINKTTKSNEKDSVNTSNKATETQSKTVDLLNSSEAALVRNTIKAIKTQAPDVERREPATKVDGDLKPGEDLHQPITKESAAMVEDLRKWNASGQNTSLNRTPKIISLATVSNLKNYTSTLLIENIALEKYLESRRSTTTVTNGNGVGNNMKKSTGNKNNNPLSVSLFYSKDFVSSRLDNDAHGFREDDKNEIKKKEQIRNSFTTGLLLNYKTGKNWSIQSGLTFSSLTTNIQPKTIYARPDSKGDINFRYNCSAGYSFVSIKTTAPPAAGDSITALTSTNTLRFIGVPFAVNYTFSNKKIDFTPGIGIGANFLTKGKLETTIQSPGSAGSQKESIDHLDGLNSLYLNALFKFSISYNVNKLINVNVTPAAQIALTSINKDAPVKTYLNTFGIAAGVTIKL